jgi:hypothetical protein
MFFAKKNKVSAWADKLSVRTVFLVCLTVVVAAWAFLTVQIHYVGYDKPYGGEFFYHSDDAAQSNVMWDWQHGYHEGARVGDDNWFIKYPLYFVTNNLPVSPLQKLFLNSIVVVLTTALLVMVALYQFAKRLITDKHRQKLALVFSSLALVAIPAQAFGTIKMSNSRNVEIGIFLLLLLALYCYVNKEAWFTRRTTLKVAGLMVTYGILLADDPLFLYLTLAPFVLTVGALYFAGKMRARRTVELLAFAGGSVATGIVVKLLITTLLPLRLYHHASNLATFDAAVDNTRHFFGSGIGIFGADVFGRQPARPSTVLAVVMAALTVMAIAGFVFSWKKRPADPFRAYLVLLWVWIPLIGVLTTLAVPSEVSRYLIVLPLLVPLGVLFATKEAKLQRQLVLIGGIVFIAAGLSLSMKGVALVKAEARPNADNFALIDSLKQLKIEKGYAPGRYAGINTFLSDRAVTIFPVICIADTPSVRDIFFDEAHVKKKTDKSFYLTRPGVGCSKKQIIDAVGEPEKTIELPGAMEALVYDFDIADKLELRKPPQ